MKRGICIGLMGLLVSGFIVGKSIATTSLPLTRLSNPSPTPFPPPERLVIPKLKLDVPIESVGLDPDGRMAVPQNPSDAGWYQWGPKPGEPGQAVIDGHLDTATSAAIFWHLNTLKPGDIIQVIDSGHVTKTFQVERLKTFKDATFPINEVFGSTNDSRLNLITCGGTWDIGTKNYSDRLVVFATLAPQRPYRSLGEGGSP